MVSTRNVLPPREVGSNWPVTSLPEESLLQQRSCQKKLARSRRLAYEKLSMTAAGARWNL